MKLPIKLFTIYLLLAILNFKEAYSQETEYRSQSIKTNIGLGIVAAGSSIFETVPISIGWQKSYGPKHKLRLNPNLILFLPFRILNLSFTLYSQSNHKTPLSALVDCKLHYDVAKFGKVSLVLSLGVFISYTANVVRTTYKPLYNVNIGLTPSFAVRYENPQGRFAYELCLINIHFGGGDNYSKYFGGGLNNYYSTILTFNLDIKLKNSNKIKAYE